MAPRTCSVFGCLNDSRTNANLAFFTLPADTKRRLQWLLLIDREDLADRAIKINHYQVCEIHFNSHDILVTSSRKMLKKNALPSLNLPNSHVEDRSKLVEDRQNVDQQVQVQPATADSASQTESSDARNCNPQTATFLSENTPRKRKLGLDLLECQKRIKTGENEDSSKKMFHELCDRFLTRSFAEIVKAHTYLKHSVKGSRYNLEYKMFCLNLYYVSPQTYRLLEKTIGLPCKTALNKMYIPISTQINNDLMRALKLKVDNMSEAEKNCSIVVDAMSLKANLFYAKKHDKIIGFHEVNGVQLPTPAKYALVVIVTGIFANWMQPVGYALLGECKKLEDVTLWIDKILIRLFEIGLKIRVFISDLRSDFLNAAEKRHVSTDTPYFYLNDKKIYYIFDPPRLMNLIRNNLMTYNFHFQDNIVAKYEHIVKFYERDKSKNYKLASKLTNSHIKPSNFEKIKVRFATQLLSKSVACGISTYIDFNVIDESGRGTVQFIQLMNDLFDTLNSSTFHHSYKFKEAFRGSDSQVEFLNKMITFFETLKLINSKTGIDGTKSVKFIQGFMITIKSVLLLCEDLKQEGFEYILTGLLNQDVIEKFFRQIKTKNRMSKEPTSWQFISAYQKLYFANILKAPQGGNCADGLSKLLIQLYDFKDINEDNSHVEHVSVPSDLDTQQEFCNIMNADYSQMKMPEKNALIYVCGFLLRKCAEKHNNCEVLKSYIDGYQKSLNLFAQSRYLKYRDYVKEGTSNLLAVPRDDFVNYIEKMEQIFKSEFERKHINSKIGRSIYEHIQNIEFIFPPPCPCFPKAYLQQLFVRMRIYFTCKFNNTAFRTCRNRRKYFSVSNL